MTNDYKGNAELYEAVEDIPGEKAMFVEASRVITSYSDRNPNKKGLDILDLCCGTAPILEYLPDARKLPLKSVTELILIEPIIEFAEQKYWERVTGMGSDWFGVELKFIEHDAVDYAHPSLVDVIIASSAYHHIEDKHKLRFLEKVKSQLKEDGIAVFCENLIGDYKNLEERAVAVTEFYSERIKEMARLGITDKRLGLVCRVLQYELDREYEWKHSYGEFLENLEKVGLRVVKETKVWPTENLFSDSKVGDFVKEVRKNE